ncbi:hypothetical protein JRQ81_012220, partial [Phrynocephalus forsythii]
QRASCWLMPVLNAVYHNMDVIFQRISLVRGKCNDSDEDYVNFLDAADKFVETVFRTVAEWRVTLPRQKNCWSYPGHSPWFHDTVLQYWDDRQWFENFCMTRQTLFEISEQLRPFLMR